jgi:GTPase involved in cell partitioning and DNA repair
VAVVVPAGEGDGGRGGRGGDVILVGFVLQQCYIPAEHHTYELKIHI